MYTYVKYVKYIKIFNIFNPKRLMISYLLVTGTLLRYVGHACVWNPVHLTTLAKRAKQTG